MNSRTRWIGLLFISIAVSLVIVDSTIVNVAIPSIVDDLGITSTEVQWVQESYTLVFAALLIVFGTLADRIGRRRMLVIGVAVFTLASIGAGLAPDGAALIAARVVQGVGGAMILPATMSLINATFRGRERGIAFAIWGSTIGGMAAVGPLLGGWLTTDFSWRWAFGVNVPFGILVIIGAFVAVAESRSDARERFDPVGALLVVVASASLVFGLIEGRALGWWSASPDLALGDWTWPWTLSPVPLAFALFVVALVLFLLWQSSRTRRGLPTLLPSDLFRVPSFRNGNVVAMIISLGELGLLFVLPLWMQNVLGYDALQAGFMLLSLAIGSFLASGVVTELSKRMSTVAILQVGVGLEAVSLVALGLFLHSDMTWTLLALILFFYGVGMGLASAQVTNVVLADIPPEQSGRASGTQSTSRQIGSALGIAVLGTTLFAVLDGALAERFAAADIPGRDELAAAVSDSAGAAIPSLLDSPATAEAGRIAAEAFTHAASVSAFVAAAFLTLGFALSFFLGAGKRRVVPTEQVTAEAGAGE